MKSFDIIEGYLSSLFVANGFKKDRLNSRLKQNGNTGLINLQKSRDLIVGGTKFTFNIGLCNNSLYLFQTRANAPSKPIV